MPVTDAIRQVFKQGRANNASSWRWIVAYFEYVTTLPFGGHCHPLLRLVRHLANTPYAQDLRAGQSLNSLLISTKNENGLDVEDPRIYVDVEKGTGQVRLEYWRAERRDGLVENLLCQEDELLKYLEPLLARLWDDTRGSHERTACGVRPHATGTGHSG